VTWGAQAERKAARTRNPLPQIATVFLASARPLAAALRATAQRRTATKKTEDAPSPTFPVYVPTAPIWKIKV